MPGRVLTDRLMELSDGRVNSEQGGFKKGRHGVHQIFAIKMVMEGRIKSYMQPPWSKKYHNLMIKLIGKLSGMS